MLTLARVMDLTPPVSVPSTHYAAFHGVLVVLSIADAPGNVVVGCYRGIGWGDISDVVSRLGRIGVGGGGGKMGGMREGVDEVVGKEEDEGVRVDIDWSDIPAFNIIDVSSDWDWIIYDTPA
ncbi:hypothetical protein BJ165DRAFT_1410412 [Panaeolus papilionaceus]|nr:hypothetical protein BJ165DRAFT_1411230 [Panaeolus papilionaceus]KAF9033336.1 hypothetical protein BJ165DRAFT_1410412 [Panaeolus papilionaceus]